MNCPICQKILREHKIDKFIVYYCDKCWGHMSYEVHCPDHNLIFVKYKFSNATTHIRKQCKTCGKIESKFYPKDIVENLETLPEANLELHNEISYKGVHDLYSRYLKKKDSILKESQFSEFISEHSAYLQSSDWKRKRLLVLKRDNCICQGCLEAKATEVHHKSYRYWKNEPLFDLISVCKKCHDNITNFDRNRRKYDFVIED